MDSYIFTLNLLFFTKKRNFAFTIVTDKTPTYIYTLNKTMTIQPLKIPTTDGNPIIIAGPCAAESEAQLHAIAKRLVELDIHIMRAGVWKPRTKPGSFEGRGNIALEWMKNVMAATGIRMATEVATPKHVEDCLESGIDVLWIGARTSTNPFAVQNIADALRGTDVTVLVKNPVSPDVDLWIGALERLAGAGIARIAAIHRGFSQFGSKVYRNAPMWQVPIELRRRLPQLPIIGDPSHIGGKRELVYPLSQEALDLGFDGLMIECHNNPKEALSDSKQQLTPDELGEILNKIKVRDRCNHGDELDAMRRDIDLLDSQLIDLLSQRISISRKIGQIKQQENMTILQAARFNSMLEQRIAEGRNQKLSDDFIGNLFATIHEESIRQQIHKEQDSTNNSLNN